jgi:predicted ester cyclase
MFVNRFEDGRVAETWAVSNPLITSQQLGINPPGFVLSAEGNKAILKRYFNEVLNKGNASLLDELMDENYVMRGPSGEELIKGREGSKAYFAQGRAAFSGLHATIDEMVAEGDKVVAAGVWEGTNTGPLQGVAPTGKHVKYGYIAIYSFAGGKITGGRILSDTVSLYQQLGTTPPAFGPQQPAGRS